jgi:hypothetical protein
VTESAPKNKGKLKPSLRVLLPTAYVLCAALALVFVVGLIRGDWKLVNIGAPGFFVASIFSMFVQHAADQKGARE